MRPIFANANTRRRLILHAGTPKTGTSALQVSFARDYETYRAAGVVYPLAGRLSAIQPKHQWVARTLRDDRESEFGELMATVETECDDRTHTIVLSTEGLYNLWPLLGAHARAWLVKRLAAYDVAWWVWFRDPVEFCTSYYVQSLWNPHSEQRTEWGRDLNVAEFLDFAHVAAKFDYRAMYRDIESVFGTGSLYGFAYARNVTARANDLLGLPVSTGPERRENVTVTTEAGVRLLRLLNRNALDAEQKHSISAPLTTLIGTIGDRSNAFAISPAEAARARALCTMSREEIASMDAESEARWRLRWANAANP